MIARLTVLLARLWLTLTEPTRGDRERGDVPGWGMVVVMTAALVIAILIPFRQAIVQAVQNALNSVTGQ